MKTNLQNGTYQLPIASQLRLAPLTPPCRNSDSLILYKFHAGKHSLLYPSVFFKTANHWFPLLTKLGTRSCCHKKLNHNLFHNLARIIPLQAPAIEQFFPISNRLPLSIGMGHLELFPLQTFFLQSIPHIYAVSVITIVPQVHSRF